jgi:1-acyl-sn-glycerol-3-phosphate acyltransferase
MANPVLGDNPFGTFAATPPPEPTPPPSPQSAEPAPPAAAPAEPTSRAAPPRRRVKRSTAATPTRQAAATPAPKAAATPAPKAAATRGRRAKPASHRKKLRDADATRAPRAAEGAPPDYGPSLDQPRSGTPGTAPGLGSEFRMMQRWVHDRLQPVLFERQQPPFSFLWRWWRRFAMRDRSEVVDEFGRDPVYCEKTEPLLDFLYRSYFRIEVSGLENIPHTGRGVIVANHSGMLPYDGIMLMHALRTEHPSHREVRPLTEDFVFYLPYLGTVVNRLGAVRACPENAERLLAQDQLIAVFPEGLKGTGKLYRERYQLQRFGRGGFVKLALRCDSPIIPAAIVGAEEVHPVVARFTWLAKNLGLPHFPITPTFPLLGPLGLVPLPTKWFIRFGAPLYFNSEHGAKAADDRILVNRLSENVRSSIQELLDSLLERRKSILFG